MSGINRRRVTTGAAWAVPVLLVGAAAPAMAASGCPSLVSAAGTATQGSRAFTITLAFSGLAGRSFCVTSVTATGPETFTQTASPCSTTSPIAVAGTRQGNGNNYHGSYNGTYTLAGPSGLTCTGHFSFTM